MKSHRTDGLSLGFGLAFLAAAVWWLVGRQLSIPLPHVGWIVAIGLILLGILGLVGALRPRKDREGLDHEGTDREGPDREDLDREVEAAEVEAPEVEVSNEPR